MTSDLKLNTYTRIMVILSRFLQVCFSKRNKVPVHVKVLNPLQHNDTF